MAFKAFFSCGFLGTFLLSSFPPSLTFSHPDEIETRRLLSAMPRSVIQQYLVPHNQVRATLGVRPLQWSDKLADFASWWANQRRGDCALIHSNSNYGENIFWGGGRNWGPSDAVAAWASEKRYYSCNQNTCLKSQDCLHYTQLVWRQSLKVGCAKVICNSGDTFITCNYEPHGNVIGQKPF